MAKLIYLFLYVFFNIISLPFYGVTISALYDPCRILNGGIDDYSNIKCHAYNKGSHLPCDTCKPDHNITCSDGVYPTYLCSPPIMPSTPALLMKHDFSGRDYWWTPLCEGKYYKNTESVVSLSTGWYDSGSRCQKMVRITANNGKRVIAKVVDECMSYTGCKEGFNRPPCGNNIVEGSDAVWNALGLNNKLHVANITWSMA